MNRMTSVEIQAYSVEEAVRLALEQLGLREEQVDIEVLSDAGPDEDAEALVRVTAKGKASQPVPSNVGAARLTPSARRVPGDRPSSRGTPPRAPRPSERPADPERVAARVDAEHEATAKEIARDLLEHMGVVADVVAVDNPSSVPLSPDEPPTIFLDILGRDLGMLIGRRGENLAQIQYIVNLLVNRKLGDWTRVIVDVEGYRSRREESLVGLAERVARQVARSHRPIVMEPMPPNERLIVHLTLRGNPEVTTESNGEGANRRITVQPRA
jgi:spoIIIJ-associated protein